MKHLLNLIFDSYPLSRWILTKFYHGYNKLKFRMIPEVAMVKQRYHRHHGRYPDLKNPSTFSEKITWLKIYDRHPVQTICADKLLVRDYVTKKIGAQHLVPLIASYNTPDEINLSDLPNDQAVIIKTTHDSKGGYIVDPSNKTDMQEIRSSLSKRMFKNHYYSCNEWQYRDIVPRIIVERFLTTDSKPVDDFKLYCCNGKVTLIQHDTDRSSSHKQNFYSLDWDPLPISFAAKSGSTIEKPSQLDDMVNYAETLANDFIFARIDFYIASEIIYFGEITFHPESGYKSFKPTSWDNRISAAISLRSQ